MNKKNFQTRKVAIVLFFILVIGLIVIISHQKARSLTNTTKAAPSPTSTSSTSINLPYPIDKPNLGMVIVVYNFFGPIKEIKDTPEGKQLILDIPNDNLPNFILNTKYTQIFKLGSNSEPTSTSIDDLKVGIKVNVQIMYDLKLSIWRVLRVDIF